MIKFRLEEKMKNILNETLIDVSLKVDEIRRLVVEDDFERAYLTAEVLSVKTADVLHLILKLSDFD